MTVSIMGHEPAKGKSKRADNNNNNNNNNNNPICKAPECQKTSVALIE